MTGQDGGLHPTWKRYVALYGRRLKAALREQAHAKAFGGAGLSVPAGVAKMLREREGHTPPLALPKAGE
jgi:hypothetical protein